MSDLLTDAQRTHYTDVWQTVEQYGSGSPGEAYLPCFLDMARPPTNGTRGSVLDAGCGSGKGGVALAAAGFSVSLVDLTPEGLTEEAQKLPFAPACLWDDLTTLCPPRRYHFSPSRGFDYVYCCDVLEHLPLPFTMLAVARMLQISRRGLFLSIALVPDVNGYWVGKPLHLSIQTFVDWRNQLGAVGTVQESRDLLHTGLYFVRPRP